MAQVDIDFWRALSLAREASRSDSSRCMEELVRARELLVAGSPEFRVRRAEIISALIATYRLEASASTPADVNSTPEQEEGFEQTVERLFAHLDATGEYVSSLDDEFARLVASGERFDSIYRSSISRFRQVEDHWFYFSRSTPIDASLGEVDVDHPEKLLTFIVAIKNRNKRTNISLKSIEAAARGLGRLIDIIVVEDTGSDSFANRAMVPCTHVVANRLRPNEGWNKAVLLNHGFERARTKYVVMSDCDFMYTNLKRLLDVIYHYRSHTGLMFHIALHETHRSSFIDDSVVSERRKFHPYSYVWIFDREEVRKIGGFNEEFSGWGYEETDLVRRVLSNESKLIFVPDVHAYHLSHDDSSRNRNNRNREIFLRNVLIPDNKNSFVFERIGEKMEGFLGAFANHADGTIDILGNGPALRNYDFTSPNVKLGFNVAYRFWERIDVYPDIYVCLDKVVCAHHAPEIRKLVMGGRIRFFVLDDVYLERFPGDRRLQNVIEYSSIRDDFELLRTRHVTTGSFGVRIAILLGFRKLNLLGMSGEYVNFIPECEEVSLDDAGLGIDSIYTSSSMKGTILRITRTPQHNPNYFFDDYQVVGDLYNIPNSPREYACDCAFHKCSVVTEPIHQYCWDLLDFDLARLGIEVVTNRDERALL